MDFNQEDFARVFAVFKEECLEHLQKLNAGFLELEKNPKQPVLIQELLREAHSIKGAARMMGFTSVEKLAHDLESALALVKKNELTINAIIMDTFCQALDEINHLLEKLEKGEETNKDSGVILQKLLLMAKEEVREPSPEPSHEPFHEAQPVTKSSNQDSEKNPQAPTDGHWEKREGTIFKVMEGQAPGRRASDLLLQRTIRVATAKLDELMSQMGEMLIARLEYFHGITDLNSIINYVDDWRRNLLKQKKAFSYSINSGEKIPGSHNLASSLGNLQILQSQLGLLQNQLNENNQKFTSLITEMEENIRKVRLLPVYTIAETFPRMVRDLARSQNKEIAYSLMGGETELDKKILEEIKDPLVHLIRNSIDHGIEDVSERTAKGKNVQGRLELRAFQVGNNVVIEVEDDGRGLNTEAIKAEAQKKGFFSRNPLETLTEAQTWDFIFEPGFSTKENVTGLSGRGTGMDVVRNNLAALHGRVKIRSTKDKGTCFILTLPLTVATNRALMVEINSEIYCLPSPSVTTILDLETKDIIKMENKEVINYTGQPVPLFYLAQLLKRAKTDGSNERPYGRACPPILIVCLAEKRMALAVDRVLGEQEILIKNLGPFLKKVKNIAGATMVGDGHISLILDVADLFRTAFDQGPFIVKPQKSRTISSGKKRSILLAEDSITTRTLEKNILESAGFQVTTALDGQDAYLKLQKGSYDLIITDVQMPNMDGFTLADKVKKHPNYKHIPVILLTSLESDDDKRRGIEVGADAYLTKGTFDQSILLNIVKRLV